MLVAVTVGGIAAVVTLVPNRSTHSEPISSVPAQLVPVEKPVPRDPASVRVAQLVNYWEPLWRPPVPYAG